MSDRKTGATSAQIEAAAKKLRGWSQRAGISSAAPWEAIGRHRRLRWIEVARAAEKDGYAIVPATAVPTPEERAAVGRLAAFVSNQGEAFGSCGDIEAAQRVADGGK